MGEHLNGFTVSLVAYGDHYSLLRRCLGSLLRCFDLSLVKSIRVGLNAACGDSRNYARDCLAALPSSCEGLLYDAGEHNRLKYPALRKMLYDPQHPILTPYVMSFDDDSALAPQTTPAWWGKVYAAMQDADLIGAPYRQRLTGNQAKAIEAQPWYGGKRLGQRDYVNFITGGWWCARTRVLAAYDFPFPAITHQGGDVVLGELCRQQNLRMRRFTEGVWINADAEGRISKAPRRGVTKPRVWANWQPGVPDDLSHHDFELTGERLNSAA